MTENMFLTTDGSKDFVEITPEIAKSIGRPSATIRLRKGWQNDSWGGAGVVHIERAERLAQLKQNGYYTARQIVQDVARYFSAIYEGGRNALFIVKQGEKIL
jgi:hypothetical protein